MRHLFIIENIERCGSNWPLGTKMCFWPKNLDIWGKKSIFGVVIAIFVNRAYHQYAWGYNFPIRTTPTQISVSMLWVIFQGSPLFMALLGLCLFIDISTLNFGLFSAKLGGTVRTIKKMTQNDNGLGPSQNYGETGDFTFNGKVFFWPKMHLNPKNTQNILRDWCWFGKR